MFILLVSDGEVIKNGANFNCFEIKQPKIVNTLDHNIKVLNN